ncbi:hypothetical protein BUALT_Bualt03G0098100 [Buddleja alternifolia]|uniref:Peroxidase n=1 Tax=Buddleja alternifolia TaxID=168488 RepID=A0AAV6XSG7_9LAMI|nr:hypothetical protein BUALT_Bualt03G0098100 [Buddleja alternifolia]
MRWLCTCAFLIYIFHLATIAATTAVAPLPLKGAASPKAKAPLIPASAFLSTTHYMNSCPNLEAIIHRKVNAWVTRDPTLAASIIRLHFHDCAVRGCDASVLLNHLGSERRAEVSSTLRGFSLIDDIKAEVEKQCPKTVSCADILTAAARDATILVGGPFWEVPFGRKDGRISISKETDTVPHGRENITSLINFFEKLGLTFVDLVVLSGSHTIGRTSCYAIRDRIFNFNGTGKPDPSMNVFYVNSLKKQCKLSRNFVNLDVMTPRTFDVAYYRNLAKKLGILATDQLLYSDLRTGPLVNILAAQPEFFTSQFAVSMVKVGNANVLVGRNQGEIRLNCNYVNPLKI